MPQNSLFILFNIFINYLNEDGMISYDTYSGHKAKKDSFYVS